MQVLFPTAFIVHCKQKIVSVQVHWLLARKSCVLMGTKGTSLFFLARSTIFSYPSSLPASPQRNFFTMPAIPRYLSTRFRIDGIKAMSLGISGGKQVLKFANTSNRGRLKQFDNFRHAKRTVRVSTSLTLLLFAVRTADLRSYCI